MSEALVAAARRGLRIFRIRSVFEVRIRKRRRAQPDGPLTEVSLRIVDALFLWDVWALVVPTLAISAMPAAAMINRFMLDSISVRIFCLHV